MRARPSIGTPFGPKGRVDRLWAPSCSWRPMWFDPSRQGRASVRAQSGFAGQSTGDDKTANCDSTPDRLDHSKRPGSSQEAVNA